jgi:hypothetical protein
MSDNAGLIKGLVVGIAALIISVLIAFVIVSNVVQVEDGISSSTVTVNNESVTFGATNVAKELSAKGTAYSCTALSSVTNGTNVGKPVLNANFTFTSGCTIINATAIFPISPDNTYWNASYTQFVSYTYKYKISGYASDNLQGNFSSGINNVSKQIPNILLIAAVVLIMGVLSFLWFQYKRMGVEESGGL